MIKSFNLKIIKQKLKLQHYSKIARCVSDDYVIHQFFNIKDKSKERQQNLNMWKFNYSFIPKLNSKFNKNDSENTNEINMLKDLDK